MQLTGWCIFVSKKNSHLPEISLLKLTVHVCGSLCAHACLCSICLCSCLYAWVYVYMHVHALWYSECLCMCTYACTCTYAHVHLVCVCVCMRVHLDCAFMHVCVWICMLENGGWRSRVAYRRFETWTLGIVRSRMEELKDGAYGVEVEVARQEKGWDMQWKGQGCQSSEDINPNFQQRSIRSIA